MNKNYQSEDNDLCSIIKPWWKHAYESGNFGDDFPPELQVNVMASKTTDQSNEFVAKTLNRIRNKQNLKKPVDMIAPDIAATQFTTMSVQKQQDISMNNVSNFFFNCFLMMCH